MPQEGNRKTVILLSGGLDSSTSAAKMIHEGYSVYPVSFSYGQRHSRELESALRISRHFNLELKEISIDLTQIGGSSLTSSQDLKDHPVEEIGREIPSTYVPSRNIIFLSLASSYAEVIGASTITYGANSVDYSGYPDCRPEFVSAMEKTLNLGTKSGIDSGIRIVAPLQFLTKGEIIKQGIELKVPYQYTWSCYRGGDRACGTCDSCILRLKGFVEADIPDPLEYERLPDFYVEFLNKKGLKK